jgi:glyoxylase-like metal-dependent hydrolase (beta-lactamase superfamily II)
MAVDAQTHGAGVGRPKPRKQEQEPASADVIEVAPGVLRAQLPIDMPGLGHVNCYVIEDERGVAVVDPGLPGPRTLKVLTARLDSVGIPLRRVHTVVVTHSHPDHFGGAGWIRKETGAAVVTHRLFHTYVDRNEPPDLDIEDAAALFSGGTTNRVAPWDATPWGGPGHHPTLRHRAFVAASRRFPHLMRTPQPTLRLADADPILLGGREWISIYTPGHTDDHLCFYDPTEGTMLSGDHVLPSITPHIGGLVRNADPLASFFASLDKVAAYGARVKVVLPAHGQPFADIAARSAAIQEHHRGRLEVARVASEAAGRPLTVMEMSTHLFSPRAQGTLADSETFAHLEHLRRAGEYRRIATSDGYRYEPC